MQPTPDSYTKATLLGSLRRALFIPKGATSTHRAPCVWLERGFFF
nr:MAG TPA: hypothetical protein [Bacteriophage sp.]